MHMAKEKHELELSDSMVKTRNKITKRKKKQHAYYRIWKILKHFYRHEIEIIQELRKEETI